MNNVIRFNPRQQFGYRTWAYRAAAGTTGGACGYIVLVSFWPDLFAHWLAGLLVACLVLGSNATALAFYAHGVRRRREDDRRRREWREARAEERRRVRAEQAAELRAAMEAPTQVLKILPPLPPEPATYGMEDRLRMRLWANLTERTGDLGEHLRDRPTPPHGWRSGVA